MGALFRRTPMQPEEILPLLAAFEQAARTPQQANTTVQTTFFLFGLAGAAAGLFVLDAVWKRRFRSVRRAMVDAVKAQSN
jgi:hypothetical protein